MSMRSVELGADDLASVRNWYLDCRAAAASSPLGGDVTAVEHQLMEGIETCLQTGKPFVLNELDVGWVLEWAERSLNPTRMGHRTTFAQEQALVAKLETLS